MVQTTQDAFHPMRGHMVDGAKITMANGEVLTLHSVLRGWELRGEGGVALGAPSADAYEITGRIVVHR